MTDLYKAINPQVTVEGVDSQPEELWCDSISLALAPSYSSAKLSYRYGLIGDTTLLRQDPLDLRGKIVSIADPDGPENSFIFRGIVEPQTDSPFQTVKDEDGNETATGNTFYTAYSLDFLLDRIYVDKTYFDDGDAGFTVNRVYPFNGGTSGIIEPNRSLTEYEDGSMFDRRNSSDTEITGTWTVYSMIADYLLPRFSPASGYTWTFNPPNQAYIDALNQIVIRFNPANKSIRQCLNELLSPERGFTWHTTFDESGNPQITPVSISDQAIAPFETEIIPANPNTVSYGSVIKFSGEISSATIGRPQNMLYSDIRLISEPVRVTCTLTLSADLMPMWSDAEKTAYEAATDAERATEKYQKVYQHFALKHDWGKTDYQALGVVPAVNEEDGTIDLSDSENAVCEYWNFERTLPYKLNTDKAKSQYKKPFLLLPDPDNAGQYIISDKAVNSPRVGFRVLDNVPGVELAPTINHIVAKNYFSGSSGYDAVYDYSAALATVSFYSDAILAIRVPGVSVSPARVKQIYIPGYHFWVTQEGTYLDADTKVTGSTEITRDDTGAFKKLAAAAKAWYGRERNIATVNYNGYADIYGYLGYIATDFYSGGSFVPGGTVISKINYVFDSGSQSTTMSTDLSDINFSEIGGRENTLNQTSLQRNLNRMQAALENVPLRTSGDGDGDTYKGFFKAIKTGASTVSIVDGNNYNADYCGYATINNIKFNIVPPAEGLSITGDAFIYLQAVYDPETETTGTPTFEQSGTYPNFEYNKFKRVIATVEFADGAAKTPVQQQYGAITGHTIGECT